MKTEKKTLRGSALFTVVAVMAILILFLTGTLALANASNSRAHKSYSISQADYTARAAIRSVRAALDKDDDFKKAMQQLDTTVTPQFVLDDMSMGSIGYWDYSTDPDDPEWVPDRITISPVAGQESWIFNPDNNKWEQWETIQVTATCRVGREEETVSAYIRRIEVPPTNNSTPPSPGITSEVKGLQEAGGNSYGNGGTIYGGLGVGLKDNGNDTYRLHNQFNTFTGLTFINGGAYVGTSSMKMNIVDNGNVKPAAGIVIMGNLVNENDTVVNVDYTMRGNFSQKDIPYLYVDQMICSTSASQYRLVDGNNQPFNVYAGTIYLPDSFSLEADLYLMDEPIAGAEYAAHKVMADGFHPLKGYEYQQDWVLTDPNEIATRQALAAHDSNLDHSGCVRCEIGHNVIGYNGSTVDKHLYKWADNTFNRRNDDYSYGGSIYCNGDLVLNSVKIPGDVRVKGKCEIIGNTTIGGDLVVENYYVNANNMAEGKPRESGLTITDEQRRNVAGRIYDVASNGKATMTLRPGIEFVKDEILPDAKVVENKAIPNTLIKDVIVDEDGKYVYGGEVYDSQPYFESVALNDDGEPTYSMVLPNVVTTEPSVRFKTGADGLIIFEGNDETGRSPIKTNAEKTYYYKIGDEYFECDREDVIGSFYRNTETGEKVNTADAYEIKYSGAGDMDVMSYPHYDEGVYPVAMERDNIYGSMVTDLETVRKGLNMDISTGYFDEKVYVREQPNVTDPSHRIQGSQDGDIVITRPLEGAEWYILDNVTIQGDKKIIIKNNPEAKIKAANAQYYGGTVRFFIVGQLTLGSRSTIMPENMPNLFYYSDDFGIEYYSGGPVKDHEDPTKETTYNEPGRIELQNNAMIVGSIKAPCMSLGSNTGEGNMSFNYVTENGDKVNIKPIIIGNALVDHVEYAQNGFVLAYTKSGSGVSTSTNTSSSDSEGTTSTGSSYKLEWSYLMG